MFGPAWYGLVEKHNIRKPVNWSLADSFFAKAMSPAGNMLPSKKIAKPVGSVTGNGAEFTMNYMNMLVVLPSVKLEQVSETEITATYFYKAPWRWGQIYLMGFLTFYFCFSALFFLSVLIAFALGKYSILEALGGALISMGFAGVGVLIFAFFNHFRRDLLTKSKVKASELIEMIQVNE